MLFRSHFLVNVKATGCGHIIGFEGTNSSGTLSFTNVYGNDGTPPSFYTTYSGNPAFLNAAQALTPELIEDMKGVLQQHPGSSPVFVHLGGDKVMQLDSKFTVDLDRVIGQIRVMFGEAAYIE